jgi:hypothetical protein
MRVNNLEESLGSELALSLMGLYLPKIGRKAYHWEKFYVAIVSESIAAE